jgi:hypothetical protein
MLPLGIVYFTAAITGLALGMSMTALPVLKLLSYVGALPDWWLGNHGPRLSPDWLDNPIGYLVCGILGVLILTLLMHIARGIGRLHARGAKVLLVTPAT